MTQFFPTINLETLISCALVFISHVDLLGVIGSTALGRPAPDFSGYPSSGLCQDVQQ